MNQLDAIGYEWDALPLEDYWDRRNGTDFIRGINGDGGSKGRDWGAIGTGVYRRDPRVALSLVHQIVIMNLGRRAKRGGFWLVFNNLTLI